MSETAFVGTRSFISNEAPLVVDSNSDPRLLLGRSRPLFSFTRTVAVASSYRLPYRTDAREHDPVTPPTPMGCLLIKLDLSLSPPTVLSVL